jgi:hypothetical protein
MSDIAIRTRDNSNYIRVDGKHRSVLISASLKFLRCRLLHAIRKVQKFDAIIDGVCTKKEDE